jgi:two-component sensor histidine kinase
MSENKPEVHPPGGYDKDDRQERAHPSDELLVAQKQLLRKSEQLTKSEAQYLSALRAGRLVYWETDLVDGVRNWTPEAMTLFGIDLPNCRGQFGGDSDEFRSAVHPDDRKLIPAFYEAADAEDWFPAEYRIVKPDGSVRWLSGGAQVVERRPDGRAARLMNVVSDVTDRKLAEQHTEFVMRELTHRAKNLLAVVLSIATQTGRSTDSFGEFYERFSSRLQGLAASHDLLVRRGWHGAPISEIMQSQLEPFLGTDNVRLHTSGPPISVTPKAAEAIGLAIHELATNAVKHGAFSDRHGSVAITWIWDDSTPPNLQLSWVEEGGPPVVPPTRKGFGHIVCERVVSDLLGGQVKMLFPPEGVRWQLSVPTGNLVETGVDS